MKTFPVIASILSQKELGEFISEKYEMEDNLECELFRTGVNHTYFMFNNDRKYVVRVYCQNWRTKVEIEQELKLLNLLKAHNISVSVPIIDKNENYIQEINAPEGLRYVVLFTFAEGEKMRFMTNETCFAIGSTIAKIHNVTANLSSINKI